MVFNVVIMIAYWELILLLIVSILPDLFDWTLLHSSEILKFRIPFKMPVIHGIFSKEIEFLPDLRYAKEGVIPELLLAGILLSIIIIF